MFKIFRKILVNLLCSLIPSRKIRYAIRYRAGVKKNSFCLVNNLWKLRYVCDISQDIPTLLKKGVCFPHPVGITIGGPVKIGKNCVIGQNVTLGANHGKFPTIEDNVQIRANTVIYGDIKIGKGSIIAPNSVVFKDVPENQIWAGNPAIFIKNCSVE